MTAVRYTIRGRYIDLKKLKSLLQSLFGDNWGYDVSERKQEFTLWKHTHGAYSNGMITSPSQLPGD